MSKEKNAAASPFFREMFQLGVYKRNQGRITRQVTFLALAIIIALGSLQLSTYLIGFGRAVQFGVPGLVVLVGWWLAYRLVNLPSFADFLIAVEAEMNKVSWPTRLELFRSSLVVIFTILFLSAILYGYDLFWSFLLRYVLQVLR